MAKITRKNMKIFGSSAGANQIEQFGSLAAGSPVFTTDPETIQALSNYLSGWFSGVVGSNSPAIEDMNALCYLFAYQLAYIFQEGIPEWSSLTTYYKGSLVNDGTGQMYKSLTDNNLNNALTSTTNWAPVVGGANTAAINPATQSPYTMTAADNGKMFLVNSANGAMQFNLPAPASNVNFTFIIKDVGGSLTNFITLHRNATEQIEGLAADYVINAPFFQGTWVTDGTNWWRKDA